MKIPLQLPSVSFRTKVGAPIVSSMPSRVLIGTSLGTKDDAESLARSQIERYFDTPDRSWLYIQEENGVGVHYEIHEGGDGYPLLPALLKSDRDTETGVIIKPVAQHAIEVFTRRNGTLHSLVLPEEQSRAAVMDPRLSFSRRRMRPHSTTGAEWVKVGLAALSMGVLMISVAGVIHKSFSLVMNGYYEIAETLPTVRLLELSGKAKTPGDTLPAIESLPIRQWQKVLQQPLNPGESVSQLSYEHGRWEIKVQSAVSTPASPSLSPRDIHAQQPGQAGGTTLAGAPNDGVTAAPVGEVQHEMSQIRGMTK